jgi:hypothetical protein
LDFIKVVSAFAQILNTRNRYPLRGLELGNPPNLSLIKEDIEKVVQFWEAQGIKTGSREAWEIEIE